jgi:hypothetical protein
MRLSRFLALAVVLTFSALLYVWQQTEIVRLAYVGQKNLTVFQESLDKNSILRYNLKQSTSLTRIGNKMLESSNFHMPETYRLVKLSLPQESMALAGVSAPKKENILSRIFGIKREAQARTIGNE